MGTLSSCIQRMGQCRASIKSWEVIFLEQLTSVRLGIGKAAKVSCRHLINPYTFTKPHLKENGSVWVPTILKKDEWLQVTSALWP